MSIVKRHIDHVGVVRAAMQKATEPVMRQVADSLARDPSEPAIFRVERGRVERIPAEDFYS